MINFLQLRRCKLLKKFLLYINISISYDNVIEKEESKAEFIHKSIKKMGFVYLFSVIECNPRFTNLHLKTSAFWK